MPSLLPFVSHFIGFYLGLDTIDVRLKPVQGFFLDSLCRRLHLPSLLYDAVVLPHLFHESALFELLDSLLHFASVKQFYGLLRQRVYLALVNTGKEVGIFVHVLTGTL